MYPTINTVPEQDWYLVVDEDHKIKLTLASDSYEVPSKIISVIDYEKEEAGDIRSLHKLIKSAPIGYKGIENVLSQLTSQGLDCNNRLPL